MGCKKKITQDRIKSLLRIKGIVPLRSVMLFYDDGSARGIFRTLNRFYVFSIKPDDIDLKLVEITREKYWKLCRSMGLRPELSVEEILTQDKVTIDDLLNM